MNRRKIQTAPSQRRLAQESGTKTYDRFLKVFARIQLVVSLAENVIGESRRLVDIFITHSC